MIINEKTRGELEAEFTKAVVKFEKEYLGRGPVDAKTYLFDDIVLVRLKGVLSPAEEMLSQNHEGRVLVREARRQLFETSRNIFLGFVENILDRQLVGFYSDISIETGERVILLTVDRKFPY